VVFNFIPFAPRLPWKQILLPNINGHICPKKHKEWPHTMVQKLKLCEQVTRTNCNASENKTLNSVEILTGG
jgi:hypothetical protein